MDDKNCSKMEQKRELFCSSLKQSSAEVIISLLEGIREKGEEYMVLPIIDTLFSSQDDRVKGIIVAFLADLKSQEAANDIVQGINSHINHNDLHLLVSVCWQSRINFSSHIDLFIELLCNSDMLTSIEACTAIENMLCNFNDEERATHMETLKRKYTAAPKEKLELIKSLIAEIDGFEEETTYD